MSLGTFTLLHVLISLVAIGSGLYTIGGMIVGRSWPTITVIFLLTTAITSLSGYVFPANGLLPSHVVGAISLVCLTVAILALYPKRLLGIWRSVYVVSAALSLYFNVVVLIIQGFLKWEPLRALAPTQSEPPFIIFQGAGLLLLVIATILALRRFKPV
ncbi:hypothetical protein [Tardiphaga sp. P9-11]|uniref:hypothetical protein n=1 Tax=Tardiphaga sp. P9-11 TaxID=2024614 RepID=UPI001FEF82D7|nr:hypothetical protein [Tardiphaga sp. P9-11]